jgi:hypothetical protein
LLRLPDSPTAKILNAKLGLESNKLLALVNDDVIHLVEVAAMNEDGVVEAV